MGKGLDKDLATKAEELLAELRKANESYEKDGGQDKAREGQEKQVKALVENDEKQAKRDRKAAKAKRAEEINEAVKAALANMRPSSKAALLGDGPKGKDEGEGRRKGSSVAPVKALKASFTKYQAGEFIDALVKANGISFVPGDRLDTARAQVGLAKLSQFATWAGPPEYSKATLGATGATGGYVLPNNLVDSAWSSPRLRRPSTSCSSPSATASPSAALTCRTAPAPLPG